MEAVVEISDRDASRSWSACPTAGATARSGTRLAVANEHPGVNSNVLTDDSVIDPLSGTVALNAIPVEIGPA